MPKRLALFESSKSYAKKRKYILDEALIPAHIRTAPLTTVIPHLYQMYSDGYGKAKKLPKVVMKTQLYAVMESRTKADEEVQKASAAGSIKLFKTSLGLDQYCLMLTDDYISYIKSRHPQDKLPLLLNKFVEEVVPKCGELSVNKELLLDRYRFTDSEVTDLIRYGVLTTKDFNEWWMAIPNAGAFTGDLSGGRQAVMRLVKQTTHGEISVNNLLVRKLPKKCTFGWLYHLTDLLGADLLTPVETVTGNLLRISK